MLAGGVAGVLCLEVVCVPLVRYWTARVAAATDALPLSQDILFRASRAFTTLWIFVLGMCVGSFLNVVIYRVPLGISVLVKGSHCPQCGEAIRPRDNLPLLGWLRLKGQCRNCGLAISSRYPIVELLIGLLFLLLFLVELISGGANLPVRTPNQMTGVQWIVFEMKWDLIAIYLYHCFLMCSLFAWAMIRHDGHQVPWKTVAIVLVMAVGAPVAFPSLQPWPWWSGGENLLPHPSISAAATSMIGMMAGVVAAGVLRVDLSASRRRSGDSDSASWLLIGASLGWQAVAGVFGLVLGWQLLRLIGATVFPVDDVSDDDAAGNPPPNTVSTASVSGQLALPLIALIHHAVWRQFAGIFVDF